MLCEMLAKSCKGDASTYSPSQPEEPHSNFGRFAEASKTRLQDKDSESDEALLGAPVEEIRASCSYFNPDDLQLMMAESHNQYERGRTWNVSNMAALHVRCTGGRKVSAVRTYRLQLLSTTFAVRSWRECESLCS